MGLVFEILASFFGGMLSEMYQQKKLNSKTFFFSILLLLLVCFTGILLCSSEGPTYESWALVVGGSFVGAFICSLIAIIWPKNRHL